MSIIWIQRWCVYVPYEKKSDSTTLKIANQLLASKQEKEVKVQWEI